MVETESTDPIFRFLPQVLAGAIEAWKAGLSFGGLG